jgi:hypothetical protein
VLDVRGDTAIRPRAAVDPGLAARARCRVVEQEAWTRTRGNDPTMRILHVHDTVTGNPFRLDPRLLELLSTQ